jgi:sugar transferase (PEP-CTERM/EpsH1 system associated)
VRILFLSQIVPYPPHGGVLQRGYNLLRQLGRSSRIHLLAFVHPDIPHHGQMLEESRRALGSFCESLEYFPLWPKASPLHYAAALAAGAVSPLPFGVIGHRSREYRCRVSSLLQQIPFDIIHADTLALAPFVPLPQRVPTALTHHNIESVLMARRAGAEGRLLAKRYLQREASKLEAYERTMAPQFDVNIVVSSVDGETLAARSPGIRTAVVPNGVDVEYFAPEPGHETPALVYTGGMNMFANRDAVMYFLTAIWPLIRARVPEVRFFAVGQDPPEELTTFANHDSSVVVTGYVEDIRPHVRQAAVYVVPLRVGGGTRLKVLDAMAMGKAMVSTSIGCEGLAVRSGAHLLVADTPDAFAASTVSLLRDADRRRALGRAARQLVEEHYAWTVVGRQLLDAYEHARATKRQES